MPIGKCISQFLSALPASNKQTLCSPLADSLSAKTHPAEPPPIIIKSYVSNMPPTSAYAYLLLLLLSK